MSPEYKVTLDEKSYDVEVKKLDEGGLLIVKVSDESFTIKPTPAEDGSWIVNDTTSDYAVKILKKTGNSVSLEIDGQEHQVAWERMRKEESVQKPTVTSRGGPRKAGGVYPPMPGKITEVRVRVGDRVKSGQTVCILEAMKMFNELKADAAGTVKEVNVDVGTMVTPADLLVSVE
jgi:biotin carboxyl carrier protein